MLKTLMWFVSLLAMLAGYSSVAQATVKPGSIADLMGPSSTKVDAAALLQFNAKVDNVPVWIAEVDQPLLFILSGSTIIGPSWSSVTLDKDFEPLTSTGIALATNYMIGAPPGYQMNQAGAPLTFMIPASAISFPAGNFTQAYSIKITETIVAG